MSNIITTRYEYREDSGHREPIPASSMDEAVREAESMLRDADWDEIAEERGGTVRPTATVVRIETDDEGQEHDTETEDVSITVDPPEPECCDSEHDWQTPHEVVGGLAENPGAWGHGGGVITTEVCAHCGRYRITDTWATDSSTGEQGMLSVSYQDADEQSLSWLDSIHQEG